MLLITAIISAVILAGVGGYLGYKKYEAWKIYQSIPKINSNIEVKKQGLSATPTLYKDSNEGVESPSNEDIIALQQKAEELGITKQKAGYLVVNKIGQTLPIYRGANQYTLSLGVATFFYDDAVMGQGNYVLAGHNMEQPSVMLSDLNQLVKGDAMDLVSEDTVFRYRVDKIEIVPEFFTLIDGKPEKGSFLSLPEQGEKAKLTLINCIYTNQGKERYVVQGHLAEMYPNE